MVSDDGDDVTEDGDEDVTDDDRTMIMTIITMKDDEQ